MRNKKSNVLFYLLSLNIVFGIANDWHIVSRILTIGNAILLLLECGSEVMNGMDKLRSSIIVLLCCLVVIGALKGMLLIMKVAIGILAVFLLVLILRKIFIED